MSDLHERVAQQFRFAYQLGSCDPKDCQLCDCFMSDEQRAHLTELASRQATEVIEWVRDESA